MSIAGQIYNGCAPVLNPDLIGAELRSFYLTFNLNHFF